MNIATINPITLPSVALEDRHQLPNAPGIYFALAPEGAILYIGKAVRIVKRWKWHIHHRYAQLAEVEGVRIAWLIVNDISQLGVIEAACIDYFSPRLNRTSTLYPGDRIRQTVALPQNYYDAIDAARGAPDKPRAKFHDTLLWLIEEGLKATSSERI